jgi:1-acyl-sn-glycerol-3-phosphate acyltransferase
VSWQLTRTAGIGREAMHRLVGPWLGVLVGGPRVSGREWLVDLPSPLIICPNHQSHLDIPVLRRALGSDGRHRLAIAAAEDYWFRRRGARILASWFAAIPFRRMGAGPGSVRAVEGLLRDGWRVVIFPEGTRSRSGEMAAFKPGAALIAVELGLSVLPVRIEGLDRVLPPGARRPRRGRASVTFGRPLVPHSGETPRAFSQRLEAAVRALEPGMPAPTEVS